MFRMFVWMTCFAAAFGTLTALPSKVEAWGHSCHAFGGARTLWGGYGMGGGFRHAGFGGYGGLSYSTGYFPIRSCYTTSFVTRYPRCLSYGPSFTTSYYGCGPQYSYPYYCPSIYASYCFPQVYSPFYCAPIAYRPVAVPTIDYPRPYVTPVIYQAPRIPLCISKPAVEVPQASWLSSAVELIDLMVHQGGGEEGLLACEQLIRVRDELPSEIYWRAAVLAIVSGRDSQEIVGLIDSAEKAGDPFSTHQLPGGSLRAYLKTADASSLDESLNRLAKAAMANENPSSDYRVLSAIFALDGQTDRARLFLAAATKIAPSAGVASLASLATLER